MARVTVEDCLELLVDQFALVHLASARYRQLHRGAERLVDNKNKDVVCALREIAAGKVRFRGTLRIDWIQGDQRAAFYGKRRQRNLR